MITIEDALKEISMLDSSKAIQASEIPVKLVKGNSIFLQNKHADFNKSISKGKL